MSHDMCARINELRGHRARENPNQRPPSEQSIAHFTEFLATAPAPLNPEIVLTFSGNIRAEWYRDRNNYLMAEFWPDGGINTTGNKNGCRIHQRLTAIDLHATVKKWTHRWHSQNPR